MSASPTIHPAAAVFPPLSPPEFKALVDDVRARGLLDPIVLDREGRLLDGRNRLRACNEADVEPRFDTYTGDDPVGFVVSRNLRRRHLDASQRALVAAQLANLRRGGVGGRGIDCLSSLNAHACALQHPDPTNPGFDEFGERIVHRPTPPVPRKTPDGFAVAPSVPVRPAAPVSQSRAAKLLGVSRRQVQAATKVARHGVPELRDAVADGSLKLRTASAIAELPADEQVAAIATPPRPDAWERLYAALGALQIPEGITEDERYRTRIRETIERLERAMGNETGD